MKTLLILFGKLMVKILKLLGKNAGNLPGCVLWTLTKHRCVSLFTVDCPIIAVTGTNGKTSVTNYVAQLFEKTGANIITNHSGNNLGQHRIIIAYKQKAPSPKAECVEKHSIFIARVH